MPSLTPIDRISPALAGRPLSAIGTIASAFVADIARNCALPFFENGFDFTFSNLRLGDLRDLYRQVKSNSRRFDSCGHEWNKELLFSLWSAFGKEEISGTNSCFS